MSEMSEMSEMSGRRASTGSSPSTGRPHEAARPRRQPGMSSGRPTTSAKRSAIPATLADCTCPVQRDTYAQAARIS
jgi:hypothetical protein